MSRHNELRDGVADLAGRAFTLSHMRNDPLIYSGRAVKRMNDTPARASRNKEQSGAPPPEVTEQKGNLLICNLWQSGTESVHYMRVVVCRRRKGGGNRCTWRHASSSSGTSTPLSPLWMDCWGWRRQQPWRGYPVDWPSSGSNHTKRRVDTSRVGLRPLWCATPTAAYGDPGCQRTGSVCSGHSGRTAQG